MTINGNIEFIFRGIPRACCRVPCACERCFLLEQMILGSKQTKGVQYELYGDKK